MTCLWLHKIYSEGQTLVPALPGPSNASKDGTRRTRSVYRIVLHLRCSEVLWKSYICTGFVPFVSDFIPAGTWREHGCRYIISCKSWAPKLHSCAAAGDESPYHALYLVRIEQFCSNAWDMLRQCIKEGGDIGSSSSASSIPHCFGKCVDWSVLATVRVIIGSDLRTS